MKKFITVVMVGDIIGQPGLRAFMTLSPSIRRKYDADFVIVNGENAADGFGLNPELFGQLRSAGADLVTSGNHIWQDKAIYSLLDTEARLLRPANYPASNPGKGYAIVEHSGIKLGVLNLQGRERMWPIDCPFRKGRELVRKLRQETNCIVVDMHAEAPDEKEALAFHLDGEISALVGTHTHVQSADERILPKGCAYISDMGACAPRHSVIGFDFRISMQRTLSMVPVKNEVGKQAAALRGIAVRIETETGHAVSIERFSEQALV